MRFSSNGCKELNDIRRGNSEKAFVFSSSLMIGGNILTPDILTVDNQGVSYEQSNKNIIVVDCSFLSCDNISAVEIDPKRISSDVIMYSRGSEGMIARSFLTSEAKKN
jgi:hypothetical protein